ncbi:hypothetical protein [Magnetospirillum fulvum]|uniref:Glycosyltransferase RgtA/B/C/D-like domain-containing protein n=1 Tax=Magnetospirillum fulvum TaxID=1082 RepID=A0A1H6H8D3_MAGFU|nr:hypothetical protein [Magnetospirillum fulvum]SEH32031.1 hypothetical protein SAMN04244559_01165 [Magnetospirillum fulvum]
MIPRRFSRDTLVLLILPILFVAVLFAMRTVSLPLWQQFNLDPDYYYLLNGLRLVEGLAPTDVSHPGTPIQVFVALVLRLMHPTDPALAVVAAVLADPEGHLLTITTFLYPLVGLALAGLGLAFRRATGSLSAGLLAQSAPFLSMIVPKFALHPKPEAFLIIAAALVLIATLPLLRPEPRRDRQALWLGLAIGFAIACKLQALTLGLVPLFLLDRRRLVLLALAVPAAFLLFTLPAWPSADIWIGWVSKMVLHSGAYGGGAATVIDPARYPRAIVALFGSKLIFTAVFVASLAALIAALRRRRFDPRSRLLAGLVLAQLFTVLIVAKQSAAHYMLPALMLTGPALGLLFLISAETARPLWHRRGWAALGLALVALTIPALRTQTAELARWTRAAQSFDTSRFAACAKIDYDTASSLPYALLRGDLNAQGRYSPHLARLMPADTYAWFVNDHTWWSHGFMHWTRRLDIATETAAYPCLVFRGSQPYMAIPMAEREIPGFRLDDRCEIGDETVFTMGVTCAGDRVGERRAETDSPPR